MHLYVAKFGLSNATRIATDETLQKLDMIPLDEFLSKTHTKYLVTMCRYRDVDCRRSWEPVVTLMGKCLKLDLNTVTKITGKAR